MIRTIAKVQTFRCILVKFDNNKRHGKFPVRTCEAYATVFPSGHVVMDSNDVQRKGYESMDDLLESLNLYGHVEVEELGEVSI